MKQTIIVTSLNYAEILAMYQPTREYVWLRSMNQHISGTCNSFSSQNLLTILYENKSTEVILKEI